MRKTIVDSFYILINKWKKSSILIALLMASILAPGLKNLEMVVGPEVWFDEGAPILSELEEFSKTFGNDETVVLLIHSEEGDIFKKEIIGSINNLTDELYQVEDVIRVESISNYNQISSEDDEIVIDSLISQDAEYNNSYMNKLRTSVMGSQELVGKMISKDLKSTLIFAHMKPYFKGHPNHTSIYNQVEKLVVKYNNKNFKIMISGSVPVAAVGKDISMKDIKTYSPLFILLVIGILAFYFRSMAGVIIPLIVIFITLLSSFGIMGYLGLKFNMLTFITPLALMAIAIADSIHFISTFDREKNNLGKEKALSYTFNKNFYPTLVTSLTTAFGFFSLATVELIPIRTLGLISGLGTLVAWVVSILIVVPLLYFMANDKKSNFSLQMDKDFTQILVDKIFKHYGKLIIFFSLTIVTAIIMASKTQVNFNFFKSLKKDVSVSRANDFILEHLGGVGGPEIVIDSGVENGVKNPEFLKKVIEFETWVKSRNEVNATSSITDVVKRMNKAINNDDQNFHTIPEKKETVAELLFLYTMGLPQGTNINHLVSLDQRKLRLSVLWSIQDAVESKIHMKEISDFAKSIGLNIFITGKIKLYQRINDTIVSSLIKSMGIALLAITIFISLILKSIKMGIFSLIPNIIPLVYGGATLFLLGNYIDSGVVVVLSVCLGIAVDDTIHFLTHYLLGKKNHLSLEKNISEVFHGTGNALVITTVILFFGFGIFSFSNYIPNSNFGILSAVILLSALILDLFLLPSLIIISDRFLSKDNDNIQIGNNNEFQKS